MVAFEVGKVYEARRGPMTKAIKVLKKNPETRRITLIQVDAEGNEYGKKIVRKYSTRCAFVGHNDSEYVSANFTKYLSYSMYAHLEVA